MKKKAFRSFLMIIAGIALTLSGVSNVFGATAAPPKTYRIVAIGDSITAGYEPGMTEKSVPYGYADRLFEQALYHGRAKLDNYGIIGLRTEGMSRLLQGTMDDKTLTSEDVQDFSDPRVVALAERVAARTAAIKTSLGQADLVVMTIGANDFTEFLQIMINESTDDAAKALDVEFITLMHKYTKTVEKVIRQTSSLAPQARILLSDQYFPLPKLFKPDLYDMLYEEAVSPLTAAVDGLAEKLRGEGLNVDAVHIADKFAGHEGTMAQISAAITGEAQSDIHPTQEGYEAIAKAFAQTVWQEYRKPSPRKTGVPVSIVAGGRELNTPNYPMVKKNITYVALGDLLQAIGTKYQWTAKTQTAVFQKNGYKVSIKIGAKTMTVNGVKQNLAAAAYVQKVGKAQQIYIPLEMIQKGLKYDVTYRQQLHTAFINP